MSFNIYFSGAVLPGHEPSQVAEKLQAKTRLTKEKVEALFSGHRKLIKKDLARDEAVKFADMMSRLGADVEIHPPLASEQPEITLEPIEPVSEADEAASMPEGGSEQANLYAPASHQEPRVFCRYCGSAISPKAHQCQQCGGPQQVGKARSRGVAALLAFFFGGFGIHRLYLGQWWGLIYLFFWPITSFISLVEAIVFLCSSDESWEGKYGNVQGTNGAIVAIVGVVLFIFIAGILAAIAVPAYHDYTVRAGVVSAVNETQPLREAIVKLHQRSGYVAMGNADIGLSSSAGTHNLGSIEVLEGGVLSVTFSTPSISGETLTWTPTFTSSGAEWDCTGGSLKNRYRPSQCKF